MEMSGKLLIKSNPGINNHRFIGESKINIPEKIPVVLNFDVSDPNAVLGYAVVTDRGEDLWCEVELPCEGDLDKLYIGGYYEKIRCNRTENGEHIISECNLVCVGVFNEEFAMDKDLYLTQVRRN